MNVANLTDTDRAKLDDIITALLRDVMADMRSGYSAGDIQAGIMACFANAGHKTCRLIQPYLWARDHS